MREERRKERLDRILVAARELFCQYGYHRTSLEDVAEKAGLGKATLYHYVSCKEDLFALVLRKVQFEYLERSRLAEEQVSSAMEKLRMHAETLLTVHAEALPLLGPAPHSGEGHMPIKLKFIKEFRTAEQEAIGRILQQGVEEGTFRRDLNVHAASVLIEMSFKAMLMEYFDTVPFGSGMIDVFMELIMNGVVAKPEN